MTLHPALEPLFELEAQLAPPVVIGETPLGLARIVPILGGTFAGPAMRGRVLPGGRRPVLHPQEAQNRA